jgi:hypothetical protein
MRYTFQFEQTKLKICETKSVVFRQNLML